MRIGLNLLYLLPDQVGGTETYAAGLLAGFAAVGSAHEFIVFLAREAAAWPLPEKNNLRARHCPVSASRRPARYWYEQFVLPRLLERESVDVVHSLGYVSPLRTPCAKVVTIHDLNFAAVGSTMPLLRRTALDFFVRTSARRCDAIVAVSTFSRGEITSRLGIPPGKVTVIHEAPDCRLPAASEGVRRALFQQWGIKEPYLVAFSSPSQHKNVPTAIAAVDQVRRSARIPHQLVLIGHRPPGLGLPSGPGERWCVATGYLDRQSVAALVSGAQAMLFLSRYEGFGLPVLEAMTFGVPVICSNRASLPEVGGDAPLYVDPTSVDGVARAIVAIARDPTLRTRMAEGSLANARRFSWEKAARETLAVYEQLVCR